METPKYQEKVDQHYDSMMYEWLTGTNWKSCNDAGIQNLATHFAWKQRPRAAKPAKPAQQQLQHPNLWTGHRPQGLGLMSLFWGFVSDHQTKYLLEMKYPLFSWVM